MEGQRRRISIVGAGNVAWNMAQALDTYVDIVQIYSRNIDNARALASRLRMAVAIDSLHDVDTEVDVVIISVADDAVADVANALPKGRAVLAHTSGSVPMEAIPGPHNGVFYALQTFSKGKSVDFEEIPFFIEASDSTDYKVLADLASLLSSKVYNADSRHRAALHVAAVFACNFVNSLWNDADCLLRPYGYDISVFAPLLRETLTKAIELGPYAAQTGPAMRLDNKVIACHKSELEPDLREIYDILTQRIIKAHFPDQIQYE